MPLTLTVEIPIPPTECDGWGRYTGITPSTLRFIATTIEVEINRAGQVTVRYQGDRLFQSGARRRVAGWFSSTDEALDPFRVSATRRAFAAWKVAS